MFAKSLKNLTNSFGVGRGIMRIDENVVEVDYDADIEHVSEDGVDEPLESSRSVRESFGYDIPLVGSISGVECGFPLVAVCDSYEMVRMAKIELGVDASLTRGIEQVGDKGKWITVLLGDLVESTVIHTEAK